MWWKSPMIVCTSILAIIILIGMTVMWNGSVVAGLPMYVWALFFISVGSLIVALIHTSWINSMEKKDNL